MSAPNAQPIFGRWSLAPVENKPAVNKLEIGASADGVETALADDSRTVVQKADIQPGGKYYCKCHLYSNQGRRSNLRI